jgi:hypothetical protein
MFCLREERTTNVCDLKQKAIEFLNKHYIRYDPKKTPELPENFYMLEPRSINGMKKIYMPYSGRENDDDIDVTYRNLSDGKLHEPVKRSFRIYKETDPIWYRKISIFGNSASKAVLGGTRRRNKRKFIRRNHKTRKYFKF